MTHSSPADPSLHEIADARPRQGETVNRITLYPPEPTSDGVVVRWRVDPPTALYRRSQFTLRFPPGVDVSRIPMSLWWTAALVCLHSHWPLLRPCEVHLPIRLRPGEVEFWSRLLDAEVAMLEAHRGTSDCERTVRILDGGRAAEPVPSLSDNGRCATAFSGGKDSLLQTGILAELTPHPVLVTVTSPMLPWRDHLTARRRYVLAEVARRRPVTHIEVETDYRSCWENEFSRSQGYPLAVSELTDTFLYFGVLLATGFASGAPHLFLASEAEVQENVERNGRVIQHPHLMYSTVTQRALQALLRPVGIRYSSLTSALHSAQVQTALWQRYRDLCDLQYSCWEVRDGEAPCSRCSQCLRIAFRILAMGEAPSRIGLDLVPLLNAQKGWVPRPLAADPLPKDRVSGDLHAQVVRDIQATPIHRVARTLVAGGPARFLTPRAGAAFARYLALRHRMLGYAVGPAPGYRRGFLRLVDPLVRERAASIFAEYFPQEDVEAYAGVLRRGDSLARWITEPIGGEPEEASAS